MGERERQGPRKETIDRGDLFFLWHPGSEQTFSGYGLALDPGRNDRLVGLLMVDRPYPADPGWLQAIFYTFGECQLVPMTAGGDRGLACQMQIAPKSTLHLRRFPFLHSRQIETALQPLLENPPRPVFHLSWDEEARLWRSEFAATNELPAEVREVFERTGYGCLVVESSIGVVHVCHAADADIAGFADKPVRYQWQLIEMRTAIIDGNVPTAVNAAEKLLSEGTEPQTIISDGVIPAMEIVGGNFECGEFFLPEMMASAIATRGIMNLLRPKLTETGAEPVAKAAIGTVKGDLHDIGKNLVAMMWEGAGFQVIDLGPDVPAEKFISAIKEDKVDLVGMSALLTTTMPMMGTIIKAIESAGLRDQVKIMIGGPGTNAQFAKEIGADGYATDASTAVRKAKELLVIETS